MNKMTPVKAWYFSDETKKLGHEDGREIAIGVEHTVKGEPILYLRGLHGSRNILDALGYAPGNIVWQVKLSGVIQEGDNVIVATSREYVAGGMDITKILKAFSRLEALSVANLWVCPDIVKQYLATGDELLKDSAHQAIVGIIMHEKPSEAWSSEETTAHIAMMAALLAIEQFGVRPTAIRTVRVASRARAREYAGLPVWDTEWAEANEAANKMLEDMVMEAIGGKS